MESKSQDQTTKEDTDSENKLEHTTGENETKTKSQEEQPERAGERGEENRNEKTAHDLILSDHEMLRQEGDCSNEQGAFEMKTVSVVKGMVENEPKTLKKADSTDASCTTENPQLTPELILDPDAVEPGPNGGNERNIEACSDGSKINSESQSAFSSHQSTVTPELTLVVFGDPDAVEPGPNLLLDLDKEKHESFSSSLYDLCGRVISIINLLGQNNTDHFPSEKSISAFLLLLPHGQHISQYESGVQWLESSFGKGALNYLLTVVTHEAKETCEDVMADLKDISSFAAERFHICTKSLRDASAISCLLGKIDILVSKNEPQGYYRPQRDTPEEQQTEHIIDNKRGAEVSLKLGENQTNVGACSDGSRINSESQPAFSSHQSTEHAARESKTKTKSQEEQPERAGERGEENRNEDKAHELIMSDHEMLQKEGDCSKEQGAFEMKTVSVVKAGMVENEPKTLKNADSTDASCTTENPHLTPELMLDPDAVEPGPNGENETNVGACSDGSKINSESQPAFSSHQSTEMAQECTEKESIMKQRHRKIEELFNSLFLHHENKLTETDFLQISPAHEPQENICKENIAFTFLKKLMMLDYKARYVQQKLAPEDHSKKDIQNDEIDIESFYSRSNDYEQFEDSNIHPLDIQMAVFHCSDSFLKQKMITKLSQCLYALPLLVPDPFTEDIECPLWTFRQIQKTWKKTETNTDVSMKSMPICKAKTSMVFCFRLGSLSASKSQLINTLINDRHSTFFHRNCSGSTKTRLLIDGVAEIAWYCPGGKSNDTFPDCVAFCNLHGDGLSYDKQRNILMDKSSVNVVFVPTLKKDHVSAQVISALLKSPKPLIVLLEDSGSAMVELKKGKYSVGLKDKGLSDISEELKRIIKGILSGPHEPFQLESMSDTGVRVDENEPCCIEGCSAATNIMSTVQTVHVSSIKSKLLPCQGKQWYEWCRINKEQYRLKGHIEKDKSQKQKQLQKLREAQCEISHGKLMELFIRHLSSLPLRQREYFLTWTKILLDSYSTDDLSSILQNYDAKWSELVSLKRKPGKTNEVEIKTKQAELEQISAKLQSATCGLEHIYREMGQIYEAHKSLKKKSKTDQTDWSKYPELAAELMISGHPMELMDGDAGHVPLTWISSLIDQVRKKLGDKRVFVLSVLGIQSSGKSTMLNAMFGLQFAVSAGRCTRGAFMQLVKLSEDMRKDFQWDYILVVDTEGLRALELEGNATIHHDNELATFVVGVGNMTLVNIFGENPSEMQDVLQIVVQAFMRMKKVKLSPSCVFVHQNVTDVAAVEKNLDAKRKLQDKLDQMAQLAAKEEGSEAVGFSDIIEFDVQKDVKYFAQLWEGSPPMAPPNPGYSECVQDLKSFILSKASKSVGVTLSEFKTKVQDLWTALLNENFVFSFKNTLEITVYRKLEVQFEKWTWALRSDILKIENQLYTRIQNGELSKVEQAHIYTSMSKTYGQVTTEMASYFEEEKDKEILIQWKAQFDQRIKNFYDDLIRQVTRKLDELIQQKEACKKVDEQKNVFKSKLLQKSKELARQLKDQAKDENALRELFESEWKLWVQDLIGNTKPIEDIDFDNDLQVILHELGTEWGFIDEALKSCKFRNLDKTGDYSSYILRTGRQDKIRQEEDTLSKETKNESRVMRAWHAVTAMLGFVSKQPNKNLKTCSHAEEEFIRDIIRDIQKKAMAMLQTRPLSKRGYNRMYLQEVAKNVIDDVTEFQSKHKISFKKEFQVDLLLYVLNRQKKYVLESHRNFKVNHDAATFLQSKEKEYYMIFRDFCRGSSSAVVLAKVICDKLKDSMTEAVCNSTAISIAGDMRDNHPAFKENRLNLEKHVLKSLAEKEDFDSYVTYIRNPKQHLKNFIKDEVKKYISETNKKKAVSLLQKNVDKISKQLNSALSEATDKVKNNANLKVWLEEFFGEIKEILTFDTVCCQVFDINNYEFLKEEVEKGLVPIVKEMKNLSLEKMNDFRRQPDQILIEQLNCCWEKCPFCAAVCTNTVRDHSPEKHSVPYHRPSGIGGHHVRGTVELVVDFCTTLVASDGKFHPQHDSDDVVPYKLYQTAGGKLAEWQITPDGSKLIYWKWFICHFQKELENYQNMKFEGCGDIPSDWRNFTKKQAIESLDEMYNM